MADLLREVSKYYSSHALLGAGHRLPLPWYPASTACKAGRVPWSHSLPPYAGVVFSSEESEKSSPGLGIGPTRLISCSINKLRIPTLFQKVSVAIY